MQLYEVFLYSSKYVQTAKTLAGMRMCTDSSWSSLIADAIGTICVRTGSNYFSSYQTHVCKLSKMSEILPSVLIKHKSYTKGIPPAIDLSQYILVCYKSTENCGPVKLQQCNEHD